LTKYEIIVDKLNIYTKKIYIFNLKFRITTFKVILYSYLILKKINERITDSYYCNKYT